MMNITTTDVIALIAVIISAFSFIYSIVLNLKQGKYIKHQDELNQILLAKEKAEKEKELALVPLFVDGFVVIPAWDAE